MASNVGQGPPAGENNEPSTLRGAVPGQGGQEGGFRSNLDDMRESINVVGKLNSAMSQFSSKIGGDGKRKIKEFSASIRSMNDELEETIKLLKEANEEGLSGGQGGGLWTPAMTTSGGVSYTKSQLPTRPGDVERDVTRATDLADMRARAREVQPTQAGQGWRTGMAIAGGAAASGTYLLSGWFANQTEQASMVDMQERRLAMAGMPVPQARGFFDEQLESRRYRDAQEMFMTQETLEQRGLRLGGAGFTQATESAGAMRQFMPHHTTEAIAGAAAELQYGMVGRELQMRGVTRHGESTDEAFRRILIHMSRDGKMPPREVLLTANPGTALYEGLLRMMNGDVEMVRMVLDWGIAEAHSIEQTGEGIELTREHARRMGLDTESVFGADLSKDAAESQRRLGRQDRLADALSSAASRAESVADWLDDQMPDWTTSRAINLGSAITQVMGAAGGLIKTIGMVGAAMAATSTGRALLGRAGGAIASGTSRAWGATGGRAVSAIRGSTVASSARGAAGTAARGAGRVLPFVRGLGLGTLASGLTSGGFGGVDAGRDFDTDAGMYGEYRARVLWETMAEEGLSRGMSSEGDDRIDELAAMILRGGTEFNPPEDWASGDAVEPAGGPPFGWVYGADHDGPGFSEKGFGGVKPHVARAGHYLNKTFGPFPGGIGGVGQRSGKSDHPRGLALDFMTMKNTKLGDRVVNFLSRNAKHFAVKYIIWKQRINSGDGRGWRKMEDRGSITANHFDHPHVSFEDAPSYGSGGFEPFTDDTDDTGAFDIGEEETTGTGFSSDASTSTSGFFSSEEADILSGMFGGSSGGEGGSRTQPGTETSGEGYTDQDAGGARPSVSGTGTLSDTEIARLAQYGGWRGSDIITATAVALAESRGNPRGIGDTHINPGTGEQSTGLWQIHYRPSRDRNNPIRNPQANLDPHQNAKNAFRIFQDQGWGAWSVHPASRGYTPSNSYTNYLDRARSAVGSLGSNVEPAGGLEMAGHLSEGQPSGGSMSVGASMPSLSASQTRQVNVRMDIKIERASREEAERLAEIVKDIVQQEEGVKMVATR